MAKPTVGWKEWIHLPELGIGPLKAKVDTGARTSALHAFDIQVDGDVVRFKVHTIQGRTDFHVQAEARLVDQRMIRDSGGKETLRPVITTTLDMAGEQQAIELSLIAREDMLFRMLVGRSALSGRFLVDTSTEYSGGVPAITKNWTPQ